MSRLELRYTLCYSSKRVATCFCYTEANLKSCVKSRTRLTWYNTVDGTFTREDGSNFISFQLSEEHEKDYKWDRLFLTLRRLFLWTIRSNWLDLFWLKWMCIGTKIKQRQTSLADQNHRCNVCYALYLMLQPCDGCLITAFAYLSFRAPVYVLVQ